jgi:hypothetical protein
MDAARNADTIAQSPTSSDAVAEHMPDIITGGANEGALTEVSGDGEAVGVSELGLAVSEGVGETDPGVCVTVGVVITVGVVAMLEMNRMRWLSCEAHTHAIRGAALLLDTQRAHS